MSIWQTKKWQEMLKKSSQVEKILKLENIYIQKRKIWLWQFWLFILWINFYDLNFELLKKIKELCKKEKAVFLQIENIDYSNFFWEDKKNLNTKKTDKNIFLENGFEKKYYKKFITKNTALIDLKKTQEEILADMKPKWRYNIRLSEKKWVKVFEVEKTDENIKIFYNLMQETTSRDNFSWNTFDYYKIFLESLEKSKLLFAEFEWKIISAWIFTYYEKVAIYYYWASTSEKKYRNLMAPYLLQWEAIKIWKDENCEIYDFLWVSWEWNEDLVLAGVTDFKLKFTKKSTKVSESLIFVNKKLKYLLMQFLRRLKK